MAPATRRRTRPSWTTSTCSVPSTWTSSTRVPDADLGHQAVDVEPGVGVARSAGPAVVLGPHRALQLGPLGLELLRRLTLGTRLRQPPAVVAQRRQLGRHLAVGRHRRLGQRGRPPPLAPPQQRSTIRGGVPEGQHRQLAAVCGGQGAELGAAQRAAVLVERGQPATAGAQHPAAVAVLLASHRGRQPGAGAHQGVRPVAVRRRGVPQRRPLGTLRKAAGQDQRDRRLVRAFRVELPRHVAGLSGQPAPITELLSRPHLVEPGAQLEPVAILTLGRRRAPRTPRPAPLPDLRRPDAPGPAPAGCRPAFMGDRCSRSSSCLRAPRLLPPGMPAVRYTSDRETAMSARW